MSIGWGFWYIQQGAVFLAIAGYTASWILLLLLAIQQGAVFLALLAFLLATNYYWCRLFLVLALLAISWLF